eukprot:m.67463 g.67463  ORF g.67463 m.67463 type:complete len:189 (-) comp13831_c0_seq1:1223-1789(-)
MASSDSGRLCAAVLGRPCNVAILAEYNYEDLELQYPLLRLKEEGANVFTVGPKAGVKYTGKHGYPCVSDKSIDDVLAENLDGLIIPGGFAPDYWRRDERFKKLCRDMDEGGKLVATICHGPWLLISAKILRGRTATCFSAICDDVENAGATYVQDEPVVVDRNLITSRTPSDLPMFLKAIIAKLEAIA